MLMLVSRSDKRYKKGCVYVNASFRKRSNTLNASFEKQSNTFNSSSLNRPRKDSCKTVSSWIGAGSQDN